MGLVVWYNAVKRSSTWWNSGFGPQECPSSPPSPGWFDPRRATLCTAFPAFFRSSPSRSGDRIRTQTQSPTGTSDKSTKSFTPGDPSRMGSKKHCVSAFQGSCTFSAGARMSRSAVGQPGSRTTGSRIVVATRIMVVPYQWETEAYLRIAYLSAQNCTARPIAPNTTEIGMSGANSSELNTTLKIVASRLPMEKDGPSNSVMYSFWFIVLVAGSVKRGCRRM
mmetsp:Transcript_20329/g.45183  ORF Transcript_20329/g.45183 Transcript_20329/m.45183 type:complete len:222 (-) Transcript_20329:1107-1772(-)